MITYDFNKITLDEIASANSEYLIIDLYNIIAPICEFKLKDKTVIHNLLMTDILH